MITKKTLKKSIRPVKSQSKKTVNAHDLLFKEVYSNEKYSLDIFKLCLSKKEFSLFNWQTLKGELNTFVDKNWKEKRADLIFSVKLKNSKKEVKIIFLLEHKSQYSPDIMRQLLCYQTGIYEKHLHPVIVVVLYSGKNKKWTGPLSFHNYLNFNQSQMRRFFAQNVLNFKIRLLNLRDLDPKIFDKRDLTTRPIFYIMANIWCLNEKTVSQLFKLGKDLNLEDRKKLIRLATGYIQRADSSFSWKLLQEIEHKALKREEKVMSTLWEGFVESQKPALKREALRREKERIRQEERKKIQEKGRQELQKAREKGLQEGLQEGRRQAVVLNLLKAGINMDVIVKATKLSKREIQKIKKRHKIR